MSASLVGSEMCIRDRPAEAAAPSEMQAIAQEFVAAVQGDGPGLREIRGAVRGTSWLGPDPRSSLARQGHRTP
eukprot:6838301-Alexandrium_andersonii.AAC.1